jgi:alpha-1,2-rhamnosyltransferase
VTSENGQVQPGTIFVDVTELVVLDLRTGIQRVVREIIEHGSQGAASVPVVPVVAVGRRFHRLSEQGWRRIKAPGSGAGEKRITHERGVHPLVRLAKRAAKVSAGFYNQLQRFYVRRLVRRRARGLYLPDPVSIGPGATLVLLDSFWGGSSALPAARHSRRAGASIVLVAYDLIPITHPQFCDYRLVQKFRPLLAQAARISDLVLAISEFCAVSFRAEFGHANVVAFPLGHDLRAGEPAPPDAWPTALWLGEDPVFMIVGSIEPRKGHRTVLDAFERRWARGERDKLLIIGKVGWQVEDLMLRLDGHEEADRRLFHVHNASDSMLKEALGRATAGIISSFVEGFGLPLAEGMSAGLPMIASDIPVFHEIAGDRALYFKPGDPAALDEAIGVLHSRCGERVRAAAEFAWPNWHEAAVDFFAKVEGRAAPAAR